MLEEDGQNDRFYVHPGDGRYGGRTCDVLLVGCVPVVIFELEDGDKSKHTEQHKNYCRGAVCFVFLPCLWILIA